MNETGTKLLISRYMYQTKRTGKLGHLEREISAIPESV